MSIVRQRYWVTVRQPDDVVAAFVRQSVVSVMTSMRKLASSVGVVDDALASMTTLITLAKVTDLAA